jgi:hypothetical protein
LKQTFDLVTLDALVTLLGKQREGSAGAVAQ